MKTLSLLASFAVTLLAARAEAIDFTPRFTDTIDDGVPFHRMYFSEGDHAIFYRPAPRWVLSGSGEAAVFRPNDSALASVKIENAPEEDVKIPFDNPSSSGTLCDIARALLPPDATQVTEIWEIPNPVVLQGWTSFEVGFDYVQSGRHFCRSILFINLDAKRQIHFIISAVSAEFQPLYKTAYRTLATWWQSPTVNGPLGARPSESAKDQ
jgi:hypothetical protein